MKKIFLIIIVTVFTYSIHAQDSDSYVENEFIIGLEQEVAAENSALSVPNGADALNEFAVIGSLNAYTAVQGALACVNSFTNQTVTTNTAVVGCSNLIVQNVTVSNNAKLTLSAPTEVIIDIFDMQSGTSLDVQ